MWMMLEHEVVKCGMCMVTGVYVLKRYNELLRKEMGEMRLQNINKEKEVMKSRERKNICGLRWQGN